MKRYRVLKIDFDTRPNVLKFDIDPSWEPEVQRLHQEAKDDVLERFVAQFGNLQHEGKLQDFLDLGAAPFSIIAYHNRFFRQARNAFVIGSYYPALTATCALGERVLNQLVIVLRDEFKATPEYKKVYRKSSFDNWDVVIDTLVAWDVLQPDVPNLLRQLCDIRNRALHFDPRTDTNDRDLALSALRVFGSILDKQFSALPKAPWYIPADVGISFVKKEQETLPFVRRVIIPSCAHVGPDHRLVNGPNWTVVDRDDYPERDVTDQEYIRLFKASQARQ